jgi:glutamine amidotransferase
MARPGLFDAIERRAVAEGAAFLGLCVGMQMMAPRGLEHGEAPGFGWIPGEVVRIAPRDRGLKIPHMGWNALEILRPHPVFAGIASGEHAYFVHSYHLVAADPAQVLALTDHGGPVRAAVGRDNLVGVQFHPEKSQATGLRLIANFLRWRP